MGREKLRKECIMVFDTRYLAKRYAEECLAISEYKIVKTQEGYVLYVPLNFIDVSRETSKNRRKYND